MRILQVLISTFFLVFLGSQGLAENSQFDLEYQRDVYRHSVSVWELQRYHGQCDQYSINSIFCASATHRYCRQIGFTVGEVLGGYGNRADVTCFGPSISAEIAVTIQQLNRFDRGLVHRDCTRNSYRCRNAINRFCRQQGFRNSAGLQEINPYRIIAGCIY